jgi:hypothetical protein
MRECGDRQNIAHDPKTDDNRRDISISNPVQSRNGLLGFREQRRIPKGIWGQIAVERLEIRTNRSHFAKIREVRRVE